MEKYNNEKYNKVRDVIEDLIEKTNSYEEVRYAKGKDEQFLRMFIDVQNTTNSWDISIDEWYDLVDLEYESYKATIQFEIKEDVGTVLSPDSDNGLDLPDGRHSSWTIFKNKILRDRYSFSREAIKNIENDSYNILRKLSLKTELGKPVKGLAVGNVQSGKTTSMAALMAMSSEYGWNVFIILTGTIGSLRDQTERRLYHDYLKDTGKNHKWELLVNPNPFDVNNPLDSIRPNLKYIITILKNHTRLEDLLNWLTSDSNQNSKLNIMVIDDESDQASVNTSTDEEERKRINDLLVKIVNSKNIDDEDIKVNYNSMNYIGYTATPYANILSEKPGESLYPQNFIALLSKSSNYIGPQEIFGIEGTEVEGLDIIRYIEDNELITSIHNELSITLPTSLKESLAYFIGSAASLRTHGFKSPVSMLIHTSNRQAHHQLLHDAIKKWLDNNREEVIILIEKVWNEEKVIFDYNDLREQLPKYPKNDNVYIKQSFTDIKKNVLELLDEISPIRIDETRRTRSYHKGLHLLIDNSSKNLRSGDLEDYRLVYPTRMSELKKTHAFIVIGGATLSRGLTLEGLVTTYFLRTTSMADTLMQMGRWFGYRGKYELYPRIWLTTRATEQFKYLANLDTQLRDELKIMSNDQIDYRKVGPRILASPSHLRMKVTSTNKQLAMKPSSYDFTGARRQTTIFEDNKDTLHNNLRVGENFINSLGMPIIRDYNKTSNIYWENVDFNHISKNLLLKYHFNKRQRTLNDIEVLIDWIEKVTKEQKLENWNVILGGTGMANKPGNNWRLDHFSYNMVDRTRKTNIISDDINIGILRAPKDLYADIELESVEDKDLLAEINKANTKSFHNIRKELGLNKTPQLIIYKINKDTKAFNLKNREDLDAPEHIIGIYIHIPGGDSNTSYITHVTVDIPEDDFMSEQDIENTEED